MNPLERKRIIRDLKKIADSKNGQQTFALLVGRDFKKMDDKIYKEVSSSIYDKGYQVRALAVNGVKELYFIAAAYSPATLWQTIDRLGIYFISRNVALFKEEKISSTEIAKNEETWKIVMSGVRAKMEREYGIALPAYAYKLIEDTTILDKMIEGI